MGKRSNDHSRVSGKQYFDSDIQADAGVSIGDGTSSVPIKVKTVDVTLATGATTTDVADFLTPGMVPLSITLKVTTAITNNGFISKVGLDGDADYFADSIGDGVVEQLNDTITINGIGTWADTSSWIAANDALRLTTNANPTSGGVVRVSMVYIDGASLY